MAEQQERIESGVRAGTRSRNQYARAVDRTQHVRNNVIESRVRRVSSIEVDPGSEEWGAAERQQYPWLQRFCGC